VSTKSIKSQIRPQRDTSRKELTALKQENKELKKKVSRLQRQVERSLGFASNTSDSRDDETESEIPLKPSGISCPTCGPDGEIGRYQTPGGKTLYACKKCKKFKQRI